MLRYLLVLVIGALIGANVAWYAARSRPADCPVAAPVPVASTATPAPDRAAPSADGATAIERPGARRIVAPAVETPAPTAGGLVVPVAGVTPAQLVDTYTQSRGEGRQHEAIDIMAPAGTPVLAAVDGPLAKMFTSVRGGLTLYQFDTEGRRVYYYAHLQGYAEGLAEGQMLRQGQVIGTVGSTGDANASAPHLHFGVGELGPDKRWSKSTPLNPYPLLAR